ncbi:hypothetical protein EPN18_06345 [bacterium]|nr:MAG: hypothetical protein EPN18_06345 [bacterium]
MTDPAIYSTILIELNKAVKMHNFYPVGHPNLNAILSKCFVLLRKSVDENGEIKFKLDQKGFYVNRVIVASGSLELAVFSKKFLYRRIKEITFAPQLVQSDLKILLEILMLEPDELLAKGGPEEMLAEMDSKGILLNEMRYEDLIRIKKELEEKKFDEEISSVLEFTDENPGSSQKQADKIEEPKKATAEEQEEALSELTERLKNETDDLIYSDLVMRIKDKTDLLTAEKKFDEIFPALVVLTANAEPDARRSEGIKETSGSRLNEMMSDTDTLGYLVKKLANKNEPNRLAIEQMLLRGKESAVELLLEALMHSSDAQTRRIIFNVIVRFGNSITPLLERRLKDPQWFVVRQMVALLGALANPESINTLINTYDHSNVKVKREVLKSLSRLPSQRATELLINALESDDPGIVAFSVISLGVLKEASAIDAIGKVAVRWERFANNQEPKKEAIKALGLIGDKKAVPVLTKILSKKAWFGKKTNEEFRALAANSLFLIGGNEAMQEIREAYKDSEGDLYKTCKRILDGSNAANAPAGTQR